jgi:hypothetical protein
MLINILKPERVLTKKEANKLKLNLEMMSLRNNARFLKKEGKIVS